MKAILNTFTYELTMYDTYEEVLPHIRSCFNFNGYQDRNFEKENLKDSLSHLEPMLEKYLYDELTCFVKKIIESPITIFIENDVIGTYFPPLEIDFSFNEKSKEWLDLWTNHKHRDTAFVSYLSFTKSTWTNGAVSFGGCFERREHLDKNLLKSVERKLYIDTILKEI